MNPIHTLKQKASLNISATFMAESGEGLIDGTATYQENFTASFFDALSPNGIARRIAELAEDALVEFGELNSYCLPDHVTLVIKMTISAEKLYKGEISKTEPIHLEVFNPNSKYRLMTWAQMVSEVKQSFADNNCFVIPRTYKVKSK